MGTHHHHGMSHHPGPSGEGGGHRVKEQRRLWLALAITGVTMVVEVIGGLWTGSLALISDAGHMLTHVAALGVSLGAIVFAASSAAPERTFGNYRAEVLAALFNAVTLVIITGLIIHEAYERFLAPRDVMGLEMLAIAFVGLAVNIATAFLLHDVGKDDLNVRSAFFHMLGDTFSSAVIVCGALVIHSTGWVWIDPALSVLVCLVILVWAWGLTRDSVRVLMEVAPKSIPVARLHAELLACHQSIAAVEDLKVWTITSGMHVIAGRVSLAEPASPDTLTDVRHALEHLASDAYGVNRTYFETLGPAPRV